MNKPGKPAVMVNRMVKRTVVTAQARAEIDSALRQTYLYSWRMQGRIPYPPVSAPPMRLKILTDGKQVNLMFNRDWAFVWEKGKRLDMHKNSSTISSKSIHQKFLQKMIFIVLISIGLWYLAFVDGEYSTFKSESASLRVRYLKSQKLMLQRQMTNIADFINDMKKFLKGN